MEAGGKPITFENPLYATPPGLAGDPAVIHATQVRVTRAGLTQEGLTQECLTQEGLTQEGLTRVSLQATAEAQPGVREP